MANCPGTRWDDWEESLTVPRLLALQREWKIRPPTHLLVARLAMWAGAYKPEPEPAMKMSNENKVKQFEKLLEMFPSGQITGSPAME